MILFKDIYNKAINLFDDPDISRAYFEDSVRFDKEMYEYLQNGVNLFTNPTKIAYLLVDQTLPEGYLEIFEGNGGKTYRLSSYPKQGSDFSFKIAGKRVLGDFDYLNNTATFFEEVPEGAQCSVEWYYSGQFNTNFEEAKTSSISTAVIRNRVMEILSRALILNWAEKERNNALDERNILNDTDFKLHSPANALRSKTEWVKQLRYDFDSMQTKLAWDVLSRKYSRGNYYA